MEPRVREILSWYSSDNPGTRTNLARLLTHGRLAGTGRLVILPVDQGFEHGPARSFAQRAISKRGNTLPRSLADVSAFRLLVRAAWYRSGSPASSS